jgi:hypothetical protein
VTLVVIACGDRDWTDQAMVVAALDHLRSREVNLTVVEGGARGADRLAGQWAAAMRARGVGWLRVPADWRRYGRGAGPVRNGQMLAYLLQARDLGHDVGVLAFHDDLERSRGTRSMVTMAEGAGVPVKLFSH